MNLSLSQKRAQSVATYIAEKGILTERISVTFFGETQPKESNETIEGRAKNRRVDFKVIKP